MSSWVLFITTYPSSKFSVGFNVQLAVLLVKNGVVLLRQCGAAMGAICSRCRRGPATGQLEITPCIATVMARAEHPPNQFKSTLRMVVLYNIKKSRDMILL